MPVEALNHSPTDASRYAQCTYQYHENVIMDNLLRLEYKSALKILFFWPEHLAGSLQALGCAKIISKPLQV